MGVFDVFKKKKEEDFSMPPDLGGIDLPPLPDMPPSQQISGMRSQGMANQDIVNSMRQQGFSSGDILNGMQASSMPPPEFQPASGMLPQIPSPPSYEKVEREEELNSRIEELAETIIAEKAKPLSEEIEKLQQWKEDISNALSQMQEQTRQIEEKVNALEKAIFAKVEEYNQNISDVNTELKAMERVFKDVMPEFTENVKELKDLVGAEKEKKSSRRR